MDEVMPKYLMAFLYKSARRVMVYIGKAWHVLICKLLTSISICSKFFGHILIIIRLLNLHRPTCMVKPAAPPTYPLKWGEDEYREHLTQMAQTDGGATGDTQEGDDHRKFKYGKLFLGVSLGVGVMVPDTWL
ncbi:unnamed protein product [Trifolium pratense]|uniref:Uncharacterized protein n=1 Tax=Trifolium pratense TaxID=57577 RepID=A0ACB0KRV3_TRIPR|nr:unnamed protein product [Trifolium pratense]